MMIVRLNLQAFLSQNIKLSLWFAVSPSSKELDLHATHMKINAQDITLCLMERNLFYKASVTDV